VGDGSLQPGVNLPDLSQHGRIQKIKVLRAYESLLCRRTRIPQVGYNDPHDPDQGAGLLKASIFLETGIKIAKRRVKRIGIPDIRLELIWGYFGKAHFLGLIQYGAVGVGYLRNLGRRGNFFKKSCAQDVINLVGVDFDRVNPDDVPVHFLIEVAEGLQGLGDSSPAGGICCAAEVRNHDTGPGELVAVDGYEQVGERDFRKAVQIGVPDGYGPCRLEIGWQLVKKDEDRLTPQKLNPFVGLRRAKGAVA